MQGETVAEADAKIIIEARVPARTTVELCTNEAAVILNEADTIAVIGSNQTAAESMGVEDIAPNLYDGCTLVFRCMIPITRQTDGKPRAFHLFWRGFGAVLTRF